MCHALLQDPKFLELLLRIDHELAAQCRAEGCRCGGDLHRADYPRKPRGCPPGARDEHTSRLSFCCSVCRKRATSLSVRFLGRRVYLGLAVVLASAARVAGAASATVARVAAEFGVTRQTLRRWQDWWRQQFPLTPLWRATCARFMPAVDTSALPAALVERFAGGPAEALTRLLVFLSPLSRTKLCDGGLHGGRQGLLDTFEGC